MVLTYPLERETLLGCLGIVGALAPAALWQLGIRFRLLKPYHDWLMKILGSISSDGTFDQTDSTIV